jgi:hypothetical protein
MAWSLRLENKCFLTSHVLMTFVDVMDVSNYSVVDKMPVINGNLYIVLARCSGYFRM